MTIRFNGWVLVLMGCLLASTAMANDEGAYLGVNAGVAVAKQSCKSPSIALGTSCMENGAAYRVVFGYQYTPTWGLELSYGNLAGASSNGTYAAGAPQLANANPPAIGPASFAWSLKANGWGLTAVATLPLTDGFSVFGKAGGVFADITEYNLVSATNGAYSFSNNTTRTTLTYGVGLQYEATPKIALRAQAESFGSYGVYPGTSKVTLWMFSGGMVFKY